MQDDLARYSCQLALPGFNRETQTQLQNAKVLIVGAGGLGCPAGQYLAAAGIGTIGLADYDSISISNLHRQILYTPADVGLKKVDVACNKLRQQNPGISVISHNIKITSGNVMELLMQYDLVMDCTDNFETKYLLNDACVLQGKPLVYGAIYQYEGQVAVWNVLNDDGTHSPNYRDLFPNVNATQVPNCADGGVMPTLAGIIGCMQANEAIKYFAKQDSLLSGKILLFEVQTMRSQIIKAGQVSNTNIKALTPTVEQPVISPKDFKRLAESGSYELIDVRSAEEHGTFNIGGKNIPLAEVENESSSIDFEKIIIMYCATGKRSGEAVGVFKNRFPGTEIFSLEGGLEALTKD